MDAKRQFWGNAFNFLFVGCGVLMGVSYLHGGQFLIAQMLCFIGIFLILLLCTYFKSNRSGEDLGYNTFIAMAISLLIGQKTPIAKWSAIALGCALSVYFCFATFRCFRTKRRDVAEYILNGRLIVGLCLCLSTGMTIGDSLGVLFYERIPEYQHHIQYEEEQRMKEVKLEPNLEKLQPIIISEEWERLSEAEKKDLLEIVVQIERTYLGLSHDLNLEITSFENPQVKGCYCDITRTIEISRDLLDKPNGLEAVSSISHEARHAYQRNIVDLYNSTPAAFQKLLLFQDAENYSSDFASYVGGEAGVDYFQQTVEIDARNYATDSVIEYLERLLKFSEENAKAA